jgi:CubicO group peptidase (beta-lactamase class C family)
MKKLNLYLIIMSFLIAVLSLLFMSCAKVYSTQSNYQAPENIDDGFEVGSLEEVNIDQALIEKAINDIDRGKYGEVHSMLIYKDSKLVVEEYFTGHKYQWDAPNAHGDLVTFTKSTQHFAHSVSKSFTSICIGIAVDNGFIQSVSQSIFDYLLEHQHLNTDGKDKITIEHLLTMTSGIQWDEWNAPYTSLENDMGKMWFDCEDPITCALINPLINEPGTSFTYNGGGIVLLGEILKNASGMDIDEFSKKYLFEPLVIDSYGWELIFENGVIDTAGGLGLTPRGMLKIGVTFLNNGTWNDKQIISKQWVEKSATTFPGNEDIKVPGTDMGKLGYSYSWWTKEYSYSGKKADFYYAGGWGGQRIIVAPGLDTVIVFTGGNYTSTTKSFAILKKYIFPAIR